MNRLAPEGHVTAPGTHAKAPEDDSRFQPQWDATSSHTVHDGFRGRSRSVSGKREKTRSSRRRTTGHGTAGRGTTGRRGEPTHGPRSPLRGPGHGPARPADRMGDQRASGESARHRGRRPGGRPRSGGPDPRRPGHRAGKRHESEGGLSYGGERSLFQGKQTSKTFGGKHASVKVDSWVGSHETYGATATAGHGKLAAEASTSYEAGSGASATGTLASKHASVSGTATAFSGSEGSAHGGAEVSKEGVHASVGADALEGGEVSGDATEKVGPAKATESASVSYGLGVKADLGGDLSLHKVGVKADLGATLGLGVSLKVDVSVDPAATVKDVGHGLSSAAHGVEHAGTSMVHGAEHLASDALGWL